MDMLSQPCHALKGVGEKTAQRLQQLNLFSVQDLLFHFPLRYQDRTRLTKMVDVQADSFVVIEGVLEKHYITRHQRSVWHGQLSDDTGIVNLQFFHFSMAQMQRFQVGTRLRCYGEVKKTKNRKQLVMVHPECLVLKAEESPALDTTLTPIYPTTEGISQNLLRKITDQALATLSVFEASHAPVNALNLLPNAILSGYGLESPVSAFRKLHRPQKTKDKSSSEVMSQARQRFVFEELLAHQLRLRKFRSERRARAALALLTESEAKQLSFTKQNAAPESLQQQCLQQLPFALTNAQQSVLKDIHKDLSKPHPMMRLIQGDVGSGKTLVAILSALTAIEQGCQACLLAPTEMLATQHFENAQALLSDLNIKTIFLSGALSEADKTDVQQRIASGEAQFIVGTHALFQKKVQFKKLVIVIIDEQHRFGVAQQEAMYEKGRYQDYHPHQLVMSATPIPRTLAMTVYADLDVSVIDELPPGRTPITTVALPNTRREEVISRIRTVCAQGRQAYWVCTLIEDSDVLQAQAAEAAASALQQQLPGLNVALVHGKMSAQEKLARMQAFKSGEVQVLVATTVIEVGVDVANASLMIIENPERLGLAQLHQLRGRVGRGATQSFCVLLYQPPLNEIAQQRLSILRDSCDGFEIAREDLALRGPGELLGTRQTGDLAFKVVNLVEDQALIPDVQRACDEMLANYPEYISPLIARW